MITPVVEPAVGAGPRDAVCALWRDMQPVETSIAFRLGERFGIDSLIPGDADNLARDLYYGPDSVTLQPILDSLHADAPSNADTSLDATCFQFYAHDDKLRSAHSLLEDFQYMNFTKRIC